MVTIDFLAVRLHHALILILLLLDQSSVTSSFKFSIIDQRHHHHHRQHLTTYNLNENKDFCIHQDKHQKMTSTTSSLYYTLTRQRVIFCQHRRAKSLLNTRLYCGNNADNDGHEANEKNQRNSFQSFGGKNNNSLLVQTLLGSVTNRATRTISNIPDSKSAYASSGKMEKDVKDDDNHNGGDENNISQKDYVENLLESVTNRASQILESSQVDDSDDNNNNAIINEAIDTTSTICEQDTNRNVLKRSTSNGSQSQTKPKHEDKRSYLENPSVTPTALAHSLWSQVVNPYIDTVIDATCGNGKDTLVLANILFPSLNETHIHPTDSESSSKTPKPQLIGIDIQTKTSM